MVTFFMIPFVYIPIVACFMVWVIITLCFCCCKSKEPEDESEEENSNPEDPEDEQEEDEDDEPGDENDAFNPEDPLNSEEQKAVDFASKAVEAELTLSEILQNPVKRCSKWFWVACAAVWLVCGFWIGCSMCTLATCAN